MYEILEELMRKNGVKAQDINRATGLHPSVISDWKRGKYTPKDDKRRLIANFFGVSLEYLDTGKLQSDERKEAATRVPVYGYVRAGIPMEAIEEILDYEEIPAAMAATGEYFALKIKGDSMEPRICDGDVVIVRRQEDAESGDLVIALVNGSDATCKRLQKYEKGLSLVSSNPTYEPMFFSQEDVQDKPVRIIGKVVENRQKY